MNPDSPFTVHGDETLEARIVAWVLGEASAFEAAELERLCEERPELLVFRRRMRALHGLLNEAEKQQPDESWKLPPEKRKVLDEMFGDGKVVRLEAEKETRVRHAGRKVLLAIAASVVLGFVVLSLVPEKYESEATFELRPHVNPFGGTYYSEVSGERSITPQLNGSEFEVLKSRNTLEKVVDKLELTRRWNVDKETALGKLKGMVDTQNIRGTDLVSVRVRSSDPQDAKDIAGQVVSSYKDYREGLERKDEQSQLAKLRKAVQAQEDKVDERRKVLATIVRTKGIIYKGSDSLSSEGGSDVDQMAKNMKDETRDNAITRGLDAQDYVDAKRDFETDQELLQQMKLKLIAEDTTSQMQMETVKVHELPVVAKKVGPLQSILGLFGNSESQPTALADAKMAPKLQPSAPATPPPGQAPVPEKSLASNAKGRTSITAGDTSVASGESLGGIKKQGAGDTALYSRDAVDITKQVARQMDLAASDKDGDLDQSIESLRQPAPADAPAEMPALSSLSGGHLKTTQSDSRLGGAVADSKSESRFRSDIIAGTALQAPATPAARPASEPMPQTAAAAPVPPPVVGGDANLAKLMSSGGSGGGELSLDTGVGPKRFETYTGFKQPSGAPADENGSNPNGYTYYWDARDEQAKGEVYYQSDNHSKGEFLSRTTEAWEAAKSAEFAAKNKASRATKESGDSPDEAQKQPPTLSLAIEDKVPTLGDIPVTGQLFQGGKDLAETPNSIVMGRDSDVAGAKRPMGVTEGNRSGDFSVARASIDGILEGKSERSPLAEREMIRRQNGVSEADRLLTEGRDAYAKGDYQAALEKYDKSLQGLPDAPMFEQQRKSYQDHRNDAAVALAMQNRKVGKYDEARKLLDQVAQNDPSNEYAKEELKFLDDPIRSNAALTYEHGRNVDAVRKNLYQAEGNYNLGKYDDAKKSYEEVLKSDPYNSAARRGLERVAQSKADYYRAAYDHTRAELLAQVDKSWEEAAPAEKDGKAFEGIARNGAPVEGEKSARIDRAMQYPTEAEPPELPNTESKPKEVTTRTKSVELTVQDEGLKVDPFWDTSKSAKERARTEYEIQTGYSSEYAFRGKDLSETTKEVVKPKPDLTKLFEEVASADEPYSTFSLNISDASFQIAQAAMAKGERPDPAGIKVEQFYNAVDYGDPAPAADEPVAVAIEQSAHPVIPGRNLVRVALKTAAAGRSASQPLHLTLLVDQSGSMSREDRRTAMKQALNGLGGLLSNNDYVTVVGFSRTPHLLADGLSGDQAKNLANLINLEASEGGTNLEEAMNLGEQLADRHKQAGAQNRIVLFTDGAANLGNADPEKLSERVKQLRQKGLAFDIAGIAAADLNDSLLAELARNGNGRYYVVGKGADESFAKQLAGAFRPAAENVKVQVHFNPERVARYKLIGFEKDRLKTEDFRNDAVDAAEMAAEEAGVAVYQIEPIAGGKGEIGEVSVRFRDTAAGQMVERTWTISHDSSAPAFDRATPSMQLATFAMLAAEKLKGGAFAEAIDFKQLAGPQANVKRFFGDQGRPAEVLRMVDALK